MLRARAMFWIGRANAVWNRSGDGGVRSRCRALSWGSPVLAGEAEAELHFVEFGATSRCCLPSFRDGGVLRKYRHGAVVSGYQLAADQEYRVAGSFAYVARHQNERS